MSGREGAIVLHTSTDTAVAGNTSVRVGLAEQAPATTRAWLLLSLLALLISGCASQSKPGDSRYYSDTGRDEAGWLSDNRASSMGKGGHRRYSSGDAAIEDALHDYYRQWQGVPYRYGGRNASGIDCSSFVRQTMGAIESLDLPRTTSEQAERGMAIDRRDLSPGDLVFFKTGGSGRHVGVYVGNGRFMHASTSQGVTISRLDNIYWRRHYWQARRVTSLTN